MSKEFYRASEVPTLTSVRINRALDALEETIEVVVARGDTHRCANRTDGSAKALTEACSAEFTTQAGTGDAGGHAERMFSRAWIAEAASTDGDAELASSRLDELVGQHAAIAHDIERDDAPARVSVAWPVDADTIVKRSKSIEECFGESCDVRRYPAYVETVKPAQPIRHGGHRQKIRRAVFKGLAARLQAGQTILNGDELHRAAAEVAAPQHPERLAPRDQRTDACRITEQLVVRERDEVRGHVRERQRAGRQIRRGVHEHAIAALLRVAHPFERMPHAREIGLRRKREQRRSLRRRQEGLNPLRAKRRVERHV